MTLTSLDSICKLISSGGTPSRKTPSFFADRGSGHPWVKSKELRDCAIADTEEHISDEGLNKSSAKYYPAHAVLIAMYGANVGQLGWLKTPATVNQPVCALIADDDKADWRYLFYTLLLNRRDLTIQAQGAAQQNLSQDLIRQFHVDLPSLPIQRRIAGILSAYDDLIENSQQRIKILEEMARRLYREWFVYFRFPGHEKCQFTDSPSGEIPEGWELKRLGDIAVVNRSTINTQNPPDRLRYIDIASVSPSQVDGVTHYLYAEAPGRARRIVEHGDILWSCVRPNRRSHALILSPEANAIASTGFAVLSATTVPFTFLYQAVTTDEFVAYLANNATGAAYPAVAAQTFENAKLVCPQAGLLQRFRELTVPIVEEAHVIRQQIQNLRRTRDLLLPHLLSGQIDVEALSEPSLAEP